MLFERFKKLSARKLVAILLTVTLISGMMGAGVYALASASAKTAEGEASAPASSQEENKSVTEGTTSSQGEGGKEETVYVLSGADGSVNSVIVSDWLKNPSGASTITDYTELKEVTNVKGDETYTLDADGNYVWSAEGKDIYYQGTTQKSLPVSVSVRYTLNGKSVSAEDLAGKSGTVTMRFDYKNNQKKTVTIDGKKETIFVPFVMVTGMVLDNDTFSNVKVTNGKIVNDGDRSVVMGLAMPGMQESLGISKKDVELPAYVEVTAEVQNFSLETVLTVATNDVFSSLDGDAVDEKSLKETAQELTNAMDQLLDGASALYDGTGKLLDKSGQLVDGVDALTAGAYELRSGADSLYEGTEALSEGTAALNQGLEELSEKSDVLNNGAAEVFSSLLSAADSQLAAAGLSLPKLTAENYSEVLNGAIASLDEDSVYQMAYQTALSQVTAGVSANEATIRVGVEDAVRKSVLEGVLKAAGQPMTAEEYAQAVAEGVISAEIQAQIEAGVSAQMQSDQVQAQIETAVSEQEETLINQQMKSDAVVSQINAAVEQAKNGADSLSILKAQLDGYHTFYDGLLQYTAGVDEAYRGVSSGEESLVNGAKTLQAGAKSLLDGSDTLYSGLGILQSGSNALVEGVAALDEGAMQLSDGLEAFQTEGIQKIIDLFEGDVGLLVERMKAIISVSQEYQNFAGISKEMNGSVKFIYRTESIGK